MYYEVRKTFTPGVTDPASLREILVEGNVPIVYSAATIKVSQTPGQVGDDYLVIFQQGQEMGIAVPVQSVNYSPSAGNQKYTIIPGNDPAWLSNTMIGLFSGADNPVTLILTVE